MKRSFIDEQRYFPLTHAQKRIYYNDIRYPGQPWANMGYIIKYKKILDFKLLEKAIRIVISKNDALRIKLVEFDFELEPFQFVSSNDNFTFEYLDFSSNPKESRLNEWIEKKNQIPFNLINSNLFYFYIIKYNDYESGYFLKIHHIISDGWSIVLLLSEINETYEALQSERAINKFSYPSYINYINDELEYINSDQFKNDRFYWQSTLLPIPDPLNLSSKKNLNNNIKANRLVTSFHSHLRSQMHEFCTINNSTIFKLIFTAFSIYLYKITGTNNILLGTANHNRTKNEYKSIMGMFVSTLLLKNYIDENKTFKSFLEETGEKINYVVKNHQRYPFNILTTELKELSDREVGNLRNISIIGHGDFEEKNYMYEYIWSGFEPEELLIHINISNKNKNGILELEWIYQIELFTEYDIRNFNRGICNVLIDSILNPDKKISEIDILAIEEKKQILFLFNNYEMNYPPNLTFQEIFQRQIALTPNNIAVSTENNFFTYIELNNRINKLTKFLKLKGLKSNFIAAVMTERSIEMIIGIYSILKAGGGYLPLDPNFPKDRINYMLKDCNIKLLITQKKYTNSMIYDTETVYVDNIVSLNNEEEIETETISKPHDIMYIIYTSGSTGKPKGVIIEHKSAMNVLSSLDRLYPLKSKDSYLFKTSYLFDVSVSEIFGWFWRGGHIFILNPGEEKDPSAILNKIEKKMITHVNFVPSMFNLFVDALDDTSYIKLASLKYIFLAGEVIQPDVIMKFRFFFSDIKIENLYGPTEATIYSSRYSIENWLGLGSIPIGIPIDNLKLFILKIIDNFHISLQPIGIPGELCVAGIGLARGYLNKPELTSEKFLNYQTFEINNRIYRTGDLCKWLKDGNIEYLSRIDHQVKIRGYRIETGEIEHQILTQRDQSVKEAIVIALEDTSNEKFLCAYIVSNITVNTSIIVQSLLKVLPNYMVPAYFVQIEKIPLTSSGKTDRKSLPFPNIKVQSEGYIAPKSLIEKKLVEIWSKTLNLIDNSIGVNDNFFNLGGHSLKAASLIAMIHKELGVKLPMHEIFNKPTIRKLGEFIKTGIKEIYSPIEPTEIKTFYSLSSAQKRLFILNLLDVDSVTYNIPMVYQLDKKPNFDHLEKSFVKIINRHECLRTSFTMFENEPVQKIHTQVNFKIEFSEVLEFNVNEFIHPFDLSTAPLLKVALINFEEKFLLFVDMHHIISDGLSFEILKKEIIAFYELGDLPELKIQYKDFVSWQKLKKNIEQTEYQEEYWLKVFKGEIPILNLPNDFPRPTTQSNEGNTIIFNISNEEINSLKIYSTLFMMLSGICSTLLGRLSGQEDIILGTTVAGREHPDLEPIIGMFVNTIALRHFPARNKRFIDFIKEVEKSNLDAFENQDYPFEILVEKLQIERDISRNPLFDVMFSLQILKDDYEGKNSNSIRLKPYRFSRTVSRFDITFFAEETNEGVIIELEYCTKLFKKATIERFIDYFKNILSSIRKNPSIIIADIEVMSEKEKRIILHQFNNSDIEFQTDKTIHELFASFVDKTPENTALVLKNNSISYKELNEKSNSIALELFQYGIQIGDIIGIIVDRSFEMISGILGILKTGGAYLPIEPTYPEERINYLLKDSGAKILLTSGERAEKINTSHIELLTLENLSLKGSLPEISFQSDSLAYIIYTSGSTGKPKGAMINHRAAVNLLLALDNLYPLDSMGNYLLKTTFLFDVSVSEIFGWFFHGGRLTILEPGGEKDPFRIIDIICKEHITHVNFVPSMFNLFVNILDEKNISKLASLKYIFLAGEAIKPESILRFRELNSKINIENLYGPTEATVYASRYSLSNWIGSGCIPIGIPIANLQLYIIGTGHEGSVSSSLQPVGIPGELCISGIGLARGYLNRPELTSEKFVFVPGLFTSTDKQSSNIEYRLYRTGDLTRWMSDGNIEYLGRIDHQVKIRGFRIETGEIESKILSQSDQQISETVVIVREDKTGEKFLCAYIVADNKVEISALNNSLSKLLPEYMIPSYFIQIEKIPLSQSGKIDRNQLPDPKIKARGEGYEAPRNDLEQKLTKIWSEILHLKEDIISIDDNFFRLGGHSLKAAVMITIIHKELEVKISMHDIFNMSTIRKLSNHIKIAQKNAYFAIEPTEEKEFYPQTSAQKRLYFINQLENNSILYNIQMMDVYCKGIEKESLEEAFRKLIKRHDSLRTSFHTFEGNAIQRIHPFNEISAKLEIDYYEMSEDGKIYSMKEKKGISQKMELPFDDVIHVAQHFIKPFNLSKPPLIRAGLIKIFGSTRILMMDMHHIISDGTSLVIMIKDLWDMYESDDLSPLKLQYKDFADWSSSENQKQELLKQEQFWLKEFSGELPVLILPYDFPRPAKITFEGDTFHFSTNEEETRRLNELARDNNLTLYLVLLSVYYILLAKLSGQEEIIVGTVTAGRDHADLQGIVGMFVDTLALRNYPEGKKTVKDFLSEVKQNTLACFENQAYPIEELVGKVASREDPGRNPLFDVVFGLENEAGASEEYLLEVLLIDKRNPYGLKRAKFDLMLMAAEKGETIQFILEYNTNLFKEKNIQRFTFYYRKIVNAVINNIWQRLDDIDIMPDYDRAEIIYLFNDTETLYPWDKTIHDLFREQAAKTPEKTAVVFYEVEKKSQRSLSYKDLDRKSDQMALLLKSNGIIAESIVGIMAQKSVGMIIGILGILKAGGAYLPLNPDYPEERKKYIMDDCHSHILLTNFKGLDYVSMNIDLDDPDIYNQNNNMPTDNGSGQLAYVMYTSGSTGKPKGVMVEHVNVIRLVKNNTFINFEEEHRILQTGALEFDASTFEIWGALLNGSTLYLTDKESILNVEKLKETIYINEITTMWMTSALFSQMLEIDIEIFKGLKYLLTGGDIVSPVHVNKLRLHFPEITIIDGYGPTENTTFSTTYTITHEIIEKSIPIGRPISNSTAYILDSGFHPVPIGVPGELYVGGDGVSRGYLNNPDLTHQKFFPNPFERDIKESSRIYATGDIARWLIDGTIEFFGRKDHQVKIRGFRIELGEIETLILSQKNIKEVVVIPREDIPGKKYLCAYFAAEKDLDILLLRKSLSETLPEYMIPSFFVQMNKIPLTTNGKVDRRQLPKPEIKELSDTYTAPRDKIEETLTNIWSDVLRVERVGIDDNFFDIGGDSIKTILISGKMHKMGLNISINDFFTCRTIRRIATRVKKIQRQISQEIITGNIELTPIHRWFFDKSFSEKHHFNHIVTLFRNERFDDKNISIVFSKLVEHHDALRTVYEIKEKNVTQRIRGLNEGKLFDLEIFELDEKDNHLSSRLEKELHRLNSSVNLKSGPLVKLGLYKTSIGDFLQIGIHHTVVDGVSWRILIEDFENAYEQIKSNSDIKLPEKTDSFKDWASKLKEYANGPKILEELSYWKSIEEMDIKSLPVDHIIEKEKKVDKNNNVLVLNLNNEKTEKLIKEVNFAFNTEINDILLTALGMAVYQWSGNEKILVNLEGHGREGIIEDININRTIGWFTSQYPLILDIAPSQSEDLEKRIRKVKETLRNVPHKGIGYGILKYITMPENKNNIVFSRQPQISFNYLGQLDAASNLTGSTSPLYDTDYLIDINGSVNASGLQLYFTFNHFQYDNSTIERLIELYRLNLEKIIELCLRRKEEIVATGMSAIEYYVMRDREVYLEKVKAEEFHNLSLKRDYTKILLTGATGFMGGYMVPALLDKTDAFLYLLVRGTTQENAENRFRSMMEFYFGNDYLESIKERIQVVRSNFSEEWLGLDSGQYKDLARNIEAIVHPAANVKHHGIYEELYKDNVIGTQNLLKFAEVEKMKDFHHVSTIDVCVGNIPGREYSIFTEFNHNIGQHTDQIYLKSKLEAEKLILNYRERGINASIYRVGNLIFHSETGKFQKNIESDYFYAIIRGVLKLGVISEKMKKMVFDMSFIDYIAKATVLLLTRKNLVNETFHLGNPNRLPMPELAEIFRGMGYEIDEVNQSEMEIHLSKFYGDNEHEKIIEMLKLHSWIFEERDGTQTVPMIDRTVRLLKKLGFQWPKVNRVHIEKMISHCHDVKFL